MHSYDSYAISGLPNGLGVCKFENTFFRYEGEWLNGKMHGKGMLMMADGGFYEGDQIFTRCNISLIRSRSR